MIPRIIHVLLRLNNSNTIFAVTRKAKVKGNTESRKSEGWEELSIFYFFYLLGFHYAKLITKAKRKVVKEKKGECPSTGRHNRAKFQSRCRAPGIE